MTWLYHCYNCSPEVSWWVHGEPCPAELLHLACIHACMSLAALLKLIDLHVTMQVALEVKRKQKTKSVKSEPARLSSSVGAAASHKPHSTRPATNPYVSQTPSQDAPICKSRVNHQAHAAGGNAGPPDSAVSTQQTPRRVSSAPPDLSPDNVLTTKVGCSS